MPSRTDYRLQLDNKFPLYKIQPILGVVPAVLEGLYTTPEEAWRAVDAYVELEKPTNSLEKTERLSRRARRVMGAAA